MKEKKAMAEKKEKKKKTASETVADSEKRLWRMATSLRTEIDSSEYRKTAVAMIAAYRLTENAEWKDIRNAETTEEAYKLMKALFDRCGLSDILPEALKNLSRETLESIMTECESFRGSFGDVYEYCLKSFAENEGKRGGEFYTPAVIHALIKRMFRPKPGASVYDPCCGAGSVFFRMGNIRAYGQEKNPDTRLMAETAAMASGMKIDLGSAPDDTLRNDLHTGRTFDYVISNPPFNVKSEKPIPDDDRWQWGFPSGPTENYAWLEHMLSHLNDGGQMACVLTISSLTSSSVSDIAVRKAFVDGGYVDAAIILPRGLFYSTPIPVCLWIMSRRKTDRVLFINSYDKLDENRIRAVAACWKEFHKGGAPEYLRFSAVAAVNEIAEKNYDLSPNSYITFTARKKRPNTRYISLADACEIKRGYSESGGTLYPLYGSSNAYARTDKLCPVSETVLIGRKGTIGNPRYVKGEFGVSATSYYIKAVKVPDLSMNYLYRYLKTIDFSVFDSGSGAPSLSSGIFKSIMIPIPEKSVQESVGRLSDSASDAEKALMSCVDSAADIMTALYRRTDFHAEKISELGKISHIKKGETPSGKGTVPFVNASVLTHPTLCRYAGRCESSNASPAGTLLVSYKLSMGRVGFSPLACTWNEGIAGIEADLPLRLYLFCFLREFEWDQLPSTSCLGRAVNLKILGDIEVPVPDADCLNRFFMEARPLYESMMHSATALMQLHRDNERALGNVMKSL